MLPVEQRLRRRGEFAVTIRTGRRAGGSAFVVHVVTPPTPPGSLAGSSRVGFVVSRAVGTAVVRNRVRRQLRHLMRPHLLTLPAGAMVVIRVLPAAAALSGIELADQLSRQLGLALAKITRSRQRAASPTDSDRAGPLAAGS